MARDSATQATLTLLFDGTDFDTNASMSVTVLQAPLATGTGPATTAAVTVTAVLESAAITGTNPASLTETNLNGADVTVTITNATYDASLFTTDFTLNGAPAGTTINSVLRDTGTQATLTLLFDGTDFDSDASMSVTVLQAAFSPVTGSVTTGTVTVTAALPVLALDDGRLFYGETGTAQALNRTWDDSLGTWSVENGTAAVSGTVRWTVNKVAPDGSEDLLGVLSDPGSGAELNLVRWDGTAWIVDWSSTAITSVNADKRGFDLEYEASSGDALVVYSNNTDTPVYRTRSGGSWSGETPLPLNDGAGPNPDPNTGIVHWVELTPRLGSDEITLAYVDANWDLVAIVWDGTQWLTASASALETNVTQSRLTPNIIQNRPVDVAYEETTGDALIAWGRHATNGFFYSTRAAGSNSWSAATGVLAPTTGDAYFVDLAAEPGGQQIAGVFMDLGGGTERLGLATWTGSAWVNPGEYDSQTRDVNDMAPGDVVAAVGWLGTSGTAVAVYSDNDVDTIDWATWTSAGGWVLQPDVTPSITGKGYTESVQIEMFGSQNELMAIFSGSNADLYAATYDGAAWTVTNSGSALETVLSSVDSAPFSFAIWLLQVSAAITGTSPASLTETNLNGATVTVELTDGTYDASLVTGDFTLGGAPAGTTIDSVARDSATQATLTLLFDGTDFDTNASLSVTVLQAALATGTGPVTTGTVTVTALLESAAITGTSPASLTETNLNGATVTVELTDGTYDASLFTTDFTLNGAPAGTTINSVARDTGTQATLTLAFDGTDFDTNASLSVTVLQAALATGTGPVTTGTVTVTAALESAAITGTIPVSLTETNLNGADVTVTITNATYDAALLTTDFTLNGAPAGTTINSVLRNSATQATLTLAFDATDFDTNASMSVTVLQAAFSPVTGSVTTGTVTVTTVVESAAITGTNPASLTETNLNGADVTVTITNATYDASLFTTDFTLNGAPTGTTINSVARDTGTQATLTLAFDATDFDANASMSVTVLQAAFSPVAGPETTGTVTVTAVVEPPPTISTMETADLDNDGFIDAIHITFSEAIKDSPASTVVADDWDVAGVTGEAFSSTTNGDTADDADIYITFQDGVLDTGQTPQVTYTQDEPTDPDVKNLAGSSLLANVTPAPGTATVQRGTVTMAASATSVDGTITTPVVLANTLLLYQSRNASPYPKAFSVTGQLIDTTTVRFQRDTGDATAADIAWQVWEDSNLTVQRGSIADLSSGACNNVTISTVDLSKSFVLVAMRSPDSATQDNNFIRARLTTTTNLELCVTRNSGGGAGRRMAGRRVRQRRGAARAAGLRHERCVPDRGHHVGRSVQSHAPLFMGSGRRHACQYRAEALPGQVRHQHPDQRDPG